MKFCSKCGKELVDEAVVCTNCGCAVPVSKSATKVVEGDAPNTGWAVLGFFIPLIGLILYIMNKDTSPLKAKSAGKGALIGWGCGLVLSIFSSVIFAML